MKIRFSPDDVRLAKYHAKQACVGGVSRVRDGDERAKELGTDQVVGQLAQLAVCKYIMGSRALYRQTRWHQNRHPKLGDGGFDLPGLNLDIKGSKLSPNRLPEDHRLPVRPEERHDGWVYVLVLISTDFNYGFLVGWASDEDLPDKPEGCGVFEGAYVLRGSDLNPIMPITWEWEVS